LPVTENLIFDVFDAGFLFYSGPTLVLALTRQNAIQHWRDLLGPKTIEEAKKVPNR